MTADPRPSKRIAKRLVVWCLGAGALLALYGGYRYAQFMAPPMSRLSAEGTYADMPGDWRHRYLQHPLVDRDPGGGSYKGFYILCPGFRRGDPVVFFLTDGQMELVDTNPDFQFFDDHLGGVSYVLIGHRGHSPTLFPEAYRKDGSLNLPLALKLYGSEQQIADVERVRQDMERRGELPPDGKISIFGASGAGFLVQQYLDAHGARVRRAIIEVSGAPDLADPAAGLNPSLAEFNRAAAVALEKSLPSTGFGRRSVAYAIYQVARGSPKPRERQLELLESLERWGLTSLLPYFLRPSTSWPLCQVLMSAPAADAARVRMYELLGRELDKYERSPARCPHPLYEWTATVLADFSDAVRAGTVPLPSFRLDRGAYGGEVLVVSGADDVVFSPGMGKRIARAYRHSRFVLLRGGHRRSREDQDFACSLRRTFLTSGLAAGELPGLLRNERVVSIDGSSPPGP